MTAKKTASPDIGNQVMQQIRSEKVTMRPKAYFIFGSLLLGLGFAAATITAIIFMSIIAHNFRTYAPHQYLHFGSPGIKPFIFNIPWVSLLISIIGIIGGISLLKRYDISYKKSFVGLVVSLITAIILLALFIDQVGINNRLQLIRPMRSFYLRQFVDQEFTVGLIQTVDNQQLKVIGPEGFSYDIKWDENTMLPHGADFKSGDMIRAVGEWQGATFSAKGIVEGPRRTPPAFKNPNIKGDFHQRMNKRMYKQ